MDEGIPRRRKLRKVSIIVGGVNVKHISFDPELSYTCEYYIQNDQRVVSEGSNNYENDDDSFIDSNWTKSEETVLRAAIDTLGFDWTRISSTWFHDEKNPEECHCKSIDLKISNRLIPNKYGFHMASDDVKIHPDRAKTHSLPAPSKPLTIRKRKELEVLEERRLFGKPRSELENQLIHRAYLVGVNRLENILKKNGIEQGDQDQPNIDITFSSLMVEMRSMNPLDVQNSIRAGKKHSTKLPKSLCELRNDQIFSPSCNRNTGIINDANANVNANANANVPAKSKSSASRRDAGRRLLNLRSTGLPIESALKDAIEILTPERHPNRSHNDEEGLVDFISPRLETEFPCLPIPPPIARFRAPKKTFFLFRSRT